MMARIKSHGRGQEIKDMQIEVERASTLRTLISLEREVVMKS